MALPFSASPAKGILDVFHFGVIEKRTNEGSVVFDCVHGSGNSRRQIFILFEGITPKCALDIGPNMFVRINLGSVSRKIMNADSVFVQQQILARERCNMSRVFIDDEIDASGNIAAKRFQIFNESWRAQITGVAPEPQSPPRADRGNHVDSPPRPGDADHRRISALAPSAPDRMVFMDSSFICEEECRLPSPRRTNNSRKFLLHPSLDFDLVSLKGATDGLLRCHPKPMQHSRYRRLVQSDTAESLDQLPNKRKRPQCRPEIELARIFSDNHPLQSPHLLFRQRRRATRRFPTRKRFLPSISISPHPLGNGVKIHLEALRYRNLGFPTHDTPYSHPPHLFQGLMVQASRVSPFHELHHTRLDV